MARAFLERRFREVSEINKITMEQIKERITHEEGSDEAWICICKNTPTSDGFYPCDMQGKEIEPTEKDGWENLYVCDRCKRIINQDTLEVIIRSPSDLL
jgi:hypothetical protein